MRLLKRRFRTKSSLWTQNNLGELVHTVEFGLNKASGCDAYVERYTWRGCRNLLLGCRNNEREARYRVV